MAKDLGEAGNSEEAQVVIVQTNAFSRVLGEGVAGTGTHVPSHKRNSNESGHNRRFEKTTGSYCQRI